MFAPALPGVPTKPNWPQPRMRLSLKESRIKLLNATDLNRKSGIPGTKMIFFDRFPPTQPQWNPLKHKA
ncbi:MAG TPA: hypothetical protein VN828_06425, partial [Acidobacteriaceae bacterium]|nr:hypothetical protein [Acidobacteriaceae bacterium]